MRDDQTGRRASTRCRDADKHPAEPAARGMPKNRKPPMTHRSPRASNAGPKMLPADAASLLPRIREVARNHFSQSSGSHDWDHTLRVHRLCRTIGMAEDADLLVAEAAAYLHDIGRSEQDRTNGRLCHAERGAAIGREILAGLPLDDERRENIIHCIAAHRFRRGSRPHTLEAKVLFDADKLDAIGAIGVARAFLFAGELGARLHSPDVDVARAPAYSVNDTGYREYVVKLSKIRERILTAAGRRLADDRHRFMTAFFNRFLEEYKGER